MFIRIIILFAIVSFSVPAQETAQNLFTQYRNALFQIQIIELESGNKSAIGSGFLISNDKQIVTNYHVISDYVYFPDQYRIEYLAADGHTGILKLVGLDVINDLALLKFDSPSSGTEVPFELAQSLPEQGVPIYSLGNPHDLGMIVVPGTFNGIKKTNFYQRIHFTGSINPGMSGGPAVNGKGEVIGVNVATAGNQIGFLIPLLKVVNLVRNADPELKASQYKTLIEQQLHDNQQELIGRILNGSWQQYKLGKALVPGKVTEFISCWGDSNANNAKAYFLSVENRCRIDEHIFLNRKLRTGALEMEFEWLSSNKLSNQRFFNFYSKSISGAGPGNPAGKDDVSNYQCQQDIISNKHNMTNKTILCLRGYDDFKNLYDVLFVGASLDHDQQGLISHFTLAGVDKASALSFTEQFMDAIAWQ